jgi:hypothetical protein
MNEAARSPVVAGYAPLTRPTGLVSGSEGRDGIEPLTQRFLVLKLSVILRSTRCAEE